MSPTVVIGGLLAVFLIANRQILLGKGFPLWDADRQFSAWQMLIGDFARNRELLLWNPWSSGGVPDFADPQCGALSPLAVVTGFIAGGKLSGFLLWWLASWFAGGVGMFFLGRHLRAPWWGSFAVALGYLFSGFYLGHAQHISWIHSYSFLPWVIWWFDRTIRERSHRLALESAALFGLSGLAGYPGLLIVTGAVLPWWALGRSLDRAREDDRDGWASSPPLQRMLVNLVMVLVISGAILAPVYAGYFTEGAGYSTRIQSGGWTRESAVSSNALHPGAFATLASPWGSEVQLRSANRLWPGTDVSSCSVYAGALIPFLALVALIARPRSRWRWWLAASIALALAIAVGDRLPLRGWLYDYFPPFRYFRHPTMFRGIAIFFAAVLALVATRDLDRVGGDRRKSAAMLLAALGLAGAAWLAIRSLLRAGEVWNVPDRALAIGHAAVWLVPIVLAGCVWRLGWRRIVPAIVVASAIVDCGVAVRLGRGTLYTENPVVRQSWQVLHEHHTSSLDLLANGRPRIIKVGAGISHNKNLPAKIPTLVNYTALINTHHERLAELPAAAALALGRDRIWFAKSAVEAPASETVTAALLTRAAAGAGLPLVIHPPESMPGAGGAADSIELAARIAGAESVAPADVTWREYTPRRLSLTARCPERGWLFVTDRWSPGWRATVNGRATPILGANNVFRAVAVEAGEGEVRFTYRPWAWPWLLVTSWGLLGIALASTGARVLLRQTGRVAVREVVLPPDAERSREYAVSIVIPAYNAAHHIAHTLASLVEHVRQSGWDAEVIVVDDGSDDATGEATEGAAREARAEPVLRLIQHERNLGKGRAVRTGMLAAHGRKVVFTDSDLPYSLKDLSAVVAALDETDVAVGTRACAGRRADPSSMRQMSSKSFSAMVSRWFGLPTADTQCGLKGFTRAAARAVFGRARVNGFSFDVEALAIARARGLRMRTVQVALRRSRPSSVRLIRHSIQMLAELIAIQLNLALRRYR